MKLKDAFEAYLEHLGEKGLSKMSLYTYRKDSEQVTVFFGETCTCEQLNRLVIGKFLKSDALRVLPSGKERSARTINKTIGFFRRFISWGMQQGWISENPLPKSLSSLG